MIDLSKTKVKESIASRLRVLILQQDDSISAFANRAGLPPQEVYRFVRGEVLPSLQNMLIISRALGCSMDFLLGDLPPEEDPGEGYHLALINARRFRSRWTSAQRQFLVFVILCLLYPEEEKILREHLGLPEDPPPGI